MIGAERLRELLCYEPDTGLLRWRGDRRNATGHAIVRAGDIAGFLHDGKWVRLKVDGRKYFAANLIWMMQTGEWPSKGHLADHRDCNPMNNRWDNLRLATHSQNTINMPKTCRNTTGLKGVSIEKGRFRASIKVHGKSFYLGRYDTAVEAHAAYCKAARHYHGDFARAA